MLHCKNTVRNLQKQEEITFETSASVCAPRSAFVLAAALCVCVLAPAASAATTMGGADTTLIPAEEENCLAWLFGTSDTITMPYLNIKGKGLQRNVTLNLVDCLVGITYTELGSIGSYVSASAAQQAWKAQAVAIHSYLEYHKQYGSSANALIYTPVDQIPSSAREAIRRAVEPVKMRSLPATAASAMPCGRPVRAITPRPACTAPAPAGTHGAPMCRICRA